ncbi:putative aldouronate transport system permease protein [Paenibacillus algorifonticola]|uniref:Putative aldouronate transport system permease protein n=1 Tax=Paenibacillus algorifonticola TaxID=684063 RepID=A0A1I2FTG5_9BACL|nr:MULTISPECIES: ABC transporter permease subunit [Paenibacillus]KQN98923.1 ABC transporter permease [Paenibacillus sp. Leaf72]SFF08704.1 putative aldouronate transport system permease protein [Paenibacillus algorifonticola]
MDINTASKTMVDAKSPKRFQSKDKYYLFLMALPFLVLAFLFSYLPLYGWIYAFYDYRPGIPLSASEFMGFDWFTSMISNEIQRQEVLRVLRNTFAISSLNIATSVLPVIFAVFLVELRSTRFKKIVQTLTTLPNFISWVLVYSFAFMLFSVDNGFLNNLLLDLGWISRPLNILASDDHTWMAMTLWSVWKGLGWGAIMYIAAITGIDQEIYEAARVDGAGRFRLMWHVTVPGIMPTFFVLLLLSIGNFINNGMEQFYVFQNAMNTNHIEVLDLYVYNIGMTNSNFGFATAVSMLKSLVSLFLLFVANSMSKIIRGDSIF